MRQARAMPDTWEECAPARRREAAPAADPAADGARRPWRRVPTRERRDSILAFEAFAPARRASRAEAAGGLSARALDVVPVARAEPVMDPVRGASFSWWNRSQPAS